MSYIGYIMGILGFAGVVWTYAQKQAERDYSVKDLQKEIIEIKGNMATTGDIKRLSDSIYYNNIFLKAKVNGIASRTTRIVNQLTYHFSRDSSITKQDLRDIMNELDVKKN